MSVDVDRLPAGWRWPANSRKAHYFQAGEITSLCKRWMFAGPTDPPSAPSPDDCAACTRAVKRLNAGRR